MNLLNRNEKLELNRDKNLKYFELYFEWTMINDSQ